MTRLVVGPFNRVEGDLEITLDITEGAVADARINAPLFRGFEMMMQGKDPRDALTITPRICGICSISQSHAAARALANLAGIKPPPQGENVANIIHAAENLSDHLTHFYLFFMVDFTRDIYRDRPWYDDALNRFAQGGAAAKQLIETRAEFMHLMGMLAGKWPHTLAIQPGGVTKVPSTRDKLRLRTILRAMRDFLEGSMFGAPLEDFLALKTHSDLADWQVGDLARFLHISRDLNLGHMGHSTAQMLSFGAYGDAFAQGVYDDRAHKALDTDAISEHLRYSWMKGSERHPKDGITMPDEDMADPAYSWCKAPRMDGKVIETGALARQVIDRDALALDLVADGSTVHSRVLGRLIEVARTQLLLEQWVDAIDPSASFINALVPVKDGEGFGLVEAARGALGHWVRVENGRIANYQIIAPTSWNFSPRDDNGVLGAAEAALIGAPVQSGETTPVAVQHIIRSFDPCMVCTVH